MSFCEFARVQIPVGKRERNAQHSKCACDTNYYSRDLPAVGDFKVRRLRRAKFSKAQPVQSIVVRLKESTHETVGIKMGLSIGECVR